MTLSTKWEKTRPFASTIMVLGDEPALHVSFGPPDTVPYRRFAFGKSARPKRN